MTRRVALTISGSIALAGAAAITAFLRSGPVRYTPEQQAKLERFRARFKLGMDRRSVEDQLRKENLLVGYSCCAAYPNAPFYIDVYLGNPLRHLHLSKQTPTLSSGSLQFNPNNGSSNTRIPQIASNEFTWK